MRLLTEWYAYATVSLHSMQNITSRQIPSTITSKGQVTVPAEVRRLLGVDTNDKIAFQITSQGDILLTVPQYRSIADLAGVAGKLPIPPTEQELKHIAAEERTNAAAKES